MTAAAAPDERAITRHVAVVAVGGNALLRNGAAATIDEQFDAARGLTTPLREIIESGWCVVLTHGNGPQVGFIKQRSDIAAEVAPALPRLDLDTCVAESQGSLGYILARTLAGELRPFGRASQVTAVVTHTVVDRADPAFDNPSKPIGSFYTEAVARRLAQEHGWTVVEDSGRGWRRVVPSPRPRRILEQSAIKTLVETGFLVIAAGGGGIPIVEEHGGRYQGMEAVIDKDYAAALLATTLKAECLVITTGVEQIAVNFGRADQRFLGKMDLDEARHYLADGQFPPGSMGPKVEAGIEFLEAGGHEVLITSPDRLSDAWVGKSGTRLIVAPTQDARKERSAKRNYLHAELGPTPSLFREPRHGSSPQKRTRVGRPFTSRYRRRRQDDIIHRTANRDLR